MLNLNNKIKTETLLNMQDKNQLLNIIEQQTVGIGFRLLASNQRFHLNKPGTEEEEIEEYLQKLMENLEMEPD